MSKVIAYRAKKKSGEKYVAIQKDILEDLLLKDKSVLKTALFLALQTKISYANQISKSDDIWFPLQRRKCGRRVDISPSSVTKAINELIEDGIIKVSEDEKEFSWIDLDEYYLYDEEDEEDEE